MTNLMTGKFCKQLHRNGINLETCSVYPHSSLVSCIHYIWSMNGCWLIGTCRSMLSSMDGWAVDVINVVNFHQLTSDNRMYLGISRPFQREMYF